MYSLFITINPPPPNPFSLSHAHTHEHALNSLLIIIMHWAAPKWRAALICAFKYSLAAQQKKEQRSGLRPIKGKQRTGEVGNDVPIEFISISFIIFIRRKKTNKHLRVVIMHTMQNYSNESNEQLPFVLWSGVQCYWQCYSSQTVMAKWLCKSGRGEEVTHHRQL